MSAKEELSKLSGLSEHAPEIMKAFAAFDAAAFKEGALPSKVKELLAVGIALTTQCPYCLAIHTDNARRAGATEAELAEVTLVAAAMRAGAAVTHGANHVVKPS